MGALRYVVVVVVPPPPLRPLTSRRGSPARLSRRPVSCRHPPSSTTCKRVPLRIDPLGWSAAGTHPANSTTLPTEIEKIERA